LRRTEWVTLIGQKYKAEMKKRSLKQNSLFNSGGYQAGKHRSGVMQNPTKLTQLIRSKLTHHFAGVKLHKASISLVSIAA
jgi:hypothetical protein